MSQSVVTLAFGFFLGLKHAFEADHLIAITTMVTEHKNPFRAALVGTFWGIGHTTILFIIGLLVLILNRGKKPMSLQMGHLLKIIYLKLLMNII